MLAAKVRQYPVLTFSLGFFCVYHILPVLVFFSKSYQTASQVFDQGPWLSGVLIFASFLLLWLLTTWIASRFTLERLKNRFCCHPYLNVTFLFLFISDLPGRLTDYIPSGFSLFTAINVFEAIVTYAWLSFLCWLFFTWLSTKVLGERCTGWVWSNRIVDIAFSFLPCAYKIALAILVEIFVFWSLFAVISYTLGFQETDLTLQLYIPT